MAISRLAGAVLVMAATVGPAHAADNAMKVCGAKYQAARTGGTLPAGQTWNQFLAQCRAGLVKPAAPAAAPVPAKAVARTAAATRTPGQPTAAQQAMYARERQCGAQYRADKAAGKTGQKWPQYWSACNKRMK